jgi:hypothetical protein
MVDSPEVHQVHRSHGRRHRGGLPRWLELVIAITALVTSVSSIAIAVHHGHIMDRLVQANSVPYMQGGFSTVTPEGVDIISLDLLNRGVGPAHEHSLRVKVEGRYVKTLQEFLDASLGPEQAAAATPTLRAMKNSVRTRFIPGGEQQFVFRITRTPESDRYWELLKASLPKWDMDYCYCSVFEDCWRVAETFAEPKPVEECVRDEPNEFTP